MVPTVVRFSSEEIQVLRRRLENLNEITAFNSDLKFASQIASLGIYREVGTINDELARFIFDKASQLPVRLDSLKSEFIQWKDLFGIRIYSADSQSLDLRTPGFYDVIHPELSFNSDGSLHSLFVFPEILQKIARHQGIDLVLVKSWGMNSIFGGFDPRENYYQTNLWELENNDALKFADLLRQGKIALMGTHDLIAHVAGLDQAHLPLLKETAHKVYVAIDAYLKTAKKPSIASLILPYTIGVVLDDLAQPPSYGSRNHLAVLNELIRKLSQNEIPADLPTLLTAFPGSFQNIIDLSRTLGIESRPEEIKLQIHSMVQEILKASLPFSN